MRAKAVRHKVTGEIFLITRSGQQISYGQDKERAIKAARQANARSDRNNALRSLGLTKVRGTISGQTYWE